MYECLEMGPLFSRHTALLAVGWENRGWEVESTRSLQVGWRPDKSCWPWGSKGITCGSVFMRWGEHIHTHTHMRSIRIRTMSACLWFCKLNSNETWWQWHTHTQTLERDLKQMGISHRFLVYCNRHVANCRSVVTISYPCEATSPDGIFCILEKRQQ